MKFSSTISKMKVKFNNPVGYYLSTDQSEIFLNNYLNSKITFTWSGQVKCVCGKIFKDFYRQNFCYNCYWNSPQASPSIFKPELCKAHLGEEERDLEWEKKFQLQEHVVYLSISSGMKVGVTRSLNVTSRWIDQGALSAIIFAKTPNRYLAGNIEFHLKKKYNIPDRTNWRKMLQNKVEKLDLLYQKNILKGYLDTEMSEYFSNENDILNIEYPVLSYPEKITSLSFIKTPIIEGVLKGIKGQYLILDQDRVLNIRKHEGFILNMQL